MKKLLLITLCAVGLSMRIDAADPALAQAKALKTAINEAKAKAIALYQVLSTAPSATQKSVAAGLGYASITQMGTNLGVHA